MITVEIVKVYTGQILPWPCRWVTGNKEFTIGGLSKCQFLYNKIKCADCSIRVYQFFSMSGNIKQTLGKG